MKKLLLFPCNGNALEAIDCVGDEYDVIGFIDDRQEKQGSKVYGIEVFSRDGFQRYQEAHVLAVPGSPVSYLQRKEIIESLPISPERFATVIHPNAHIGAFVQIGYNVLIMAGVVITSNGIIDNHVCILPNSVIHHDTEIQEYCLIGANVSIAGNVRIRENCYIGSGSRIINDVEIGEKTLVGLGTNVITSLPPHAKAVGNPARIIGEV